MKKDCMFQYATKNKIIENTELITLQEAESLVNKYLEHIKNNWNEFDSPEMAIWINCKNNTDYHEMKLNIDFRDCELRNGHFYRIKKEKVI